MSLLEGAIVRRFYEAKVGQIWIDYYRYMAFWYQKPSKLVIHITSWIIFFLYITERSSRIKSDWWAIRPTGHRERQESYSALCSHIGFCFVCFVSSSAYVAGTKSSILSKTIKLCVVARECQLKPLYWLLFMEIHSGFWSDMSKCNNNRRASMRNIPWNYLRMSTSSYFFVLLML